ncbi:leucyl/phenylalanyl-tRNA--protein transferase [Croceitalea sp. MTPC5]|uniref:leucyl/phenylalanyl-tRNA--protein transferase n=1 Tax=Croceitalea sp. MTPC5 TaxID=3056565 RepID=UPI002B3F1D3F|nr:leucyl/phenylalanyl-tRNA--protein transferase [Croceitalea sp. MTPC5]
MENKGKNKPLFFLNDRLYFPPVTEANAEGLLAVGGDLSPERLLLAYQNGIFPWFNEDDLILWWSPDPRMVLYPQKLKVSKSMQKIMNGDQFRLTMDTCFDEVVEQCALLKRKGQEGTWITPKMKEAYAQLHEKGFARSYEVWQDDKLVGGLYGIDLETIFCGESMFSSVSNASKFAFIKLAQELEKKAYQLIDCQVYTRHLESLGAEEIARADFIEILKGKV